MRELRTRRIINWILLGLAIITVIGYWPSLSEWALPDWLAGISLAVLAMLAELLSRTPRHEDAAPFSFLPVLTAFFLFGPARACLIAMAGFVAADVILAITRIIADPYADQNKTVPAYSLAGRQGMRVLLTTLIGYGARYLPEITLPFTSVTVLSVVMMIALAIVAVMADEGALLALDRLDNPGKIHSISRSALVVRIVSIFFAVTAVLLTASYGYNALFFAEAVMALAVLTYSDLTQSRQLLEQQMERLVMLGELDRTIRPSLTTESILDYYYVQINAISGLDQMRIILTGQGDISAGLRVIHAVEEGRPIPVTDVPEDGLFKRVFETREPLFADPLEPQSPELAGCQPLPAASRWVGLPLLDGKAIFGIVVLSSKRDDHPVPALQPGEKELIKLMTAQVETSLQNALLYQSARRYAEQMSRLNRISAMINVSMNPEEVLDVVMESINEVLGCDKAALYLLGDKSGNGNPLVLTKQQGFAVEMIGDLREIASLLTATQRNTLLIEGERVIIPNIKHTTASLTDRMIGFTRMNDISAFAVFPMRQAEDIIGLLVTLYSQPHDFTSSELEMLDTFTNQASLAVTNSRIFQQADTELNRRVGQIVRMFGVSKQLSATLEKEAIFDTIILSAVEQCDSDLGLLLIESDEKVAGGRQFTVVASAGFDGPADPRVARLARYAGQSGVIASGAPNFFTTSEEGCRGSCLLAPIILDRRVTGLIAINSANPDHFSEEDLQFVSQLASQAGLAIRNAQLYQATQLVSDRLKSILDASRDGLVMLDTEGAMVMTNAMMESLWKLLPPDSPSAPGSTGSLSSLERRLGYAAGDLAHLLEEGKSGRLSAPVTHNLVLAPQDAPARFIDKIASTVTDEGGGFIGLLLVLRDVTEQKSLDEARARLTELIVHDLRAPLQAVMGSLKLIENFTDRDKEPIKQGLDMSDRAITKMLRMVNNLLDLSRMERGEMQLERNIESVRPVIEDALFELAPLIAESGIEVVAEYDDDLPYLDIDSEIIERVIINLIDNALKYASASQRITITAETLETEGGRSVRVSITDQGPGIPEDFREMIWGRFSMIPGRKARRSSAGLGLNFCQLAIETHKGRIGVENAPGTGAVFFFILPAVDFHEFEARVYDA